MELLPLNSNHLEIDRAFGVCSFPVFVEAMIVLVKALNGDENSEGWNKTVADKLEATVNSVSDGKTLCGFNGSQGWVGV